MATCYSDRLLFIHIPRCGGTSITDYLMLTIRGMTHSKFPIGHIRLQDVEYFIGRKPSSFEKIIAIVRNPFDLEVSCFNYARKLVIDNREGALWHFQAFSYLDVSGCCQDPLCKFNYYYERKFLPEIYGTCEMSLLEIDERMREHGVQKYWVSVDGEVPVNLEIIKFENLADVIEKTVRYRQADIPLPHVNGTKNETNTLNRFDRQARDSVLRNYHWTIDNYYPELLAV